MVRILNNWLLQTSIANITSVLTQILHSDLYTKCNSFLRSEAIHVISVGFHENVMVFNKTMIYELDIKQILIKVYRVN